MDAKKVGSLFKKHIENKQLDKAETFFNNKNIRIAMQKINFIPISGINKPEGDIDQYFIKPAVVKNKIINNIKDTFRSKYEKYILSLNSKGYTISEAKKIIATISKPSDSKKKVTELIANVLTKQQKMKGYTSQLQYKNDFKEATDHLKSLGYKDENLITDSVLCTQELTSDRHAFLAAIKNTPTSSDKSKGYKSVTQKASVLKNATYALINQGYSADTAKNHAKTLQKNTSYAGFKEAINFIKEVYAQKKSTIFSLIEKKEYTEQQATDIFEDIVLKSTNMDDFNSHIEDYINDSQYDTILEFDDFSEFGDLSEDEGFSEDEDFVKNENVIKGKRWDFSKGKKSYAMGGPRSRGNFYFGGHTEEEGKKRSKALAILGIQTIRPTQAQIKRVFSRLSKEYHDNNSVDKEAEKKFKKMSNAYDLLMNI